MTRLNKMMAASFAIALAASLALPNPAEAQRKRAHNTMAGAVIGSSVGYLVGGQNGAQAGAVVGAIAGYNK